MKKTIIFAACSAVMLAACTEMQLANHVFKKVNDQSAPYSAPPIKVKRKTGNPYTINGITYYPLPSSEGYRMRGIASWYGKDFHKKKTANGEIYDMYAWTAAHPTLPLPTWVRVTNLENGRSIRVRVNDRGPFARGRLIDLSYRSAQALDMVEAGTAPVLVEALPTDGSPLRMPATRIVKTPEVKTRTVTEPTRKSFTYRVSEKRNTVNASDLSVTEVDTTEAVDDAAMPKLEASQSIEAIKTAEADSSEIANAIASRAQATQVSAAKSMKAAEEETHYKNVKIYVQTGAFSSLENAERQLEKVKLLAEKALILKVNRNGQILHKVRLGPVDTVESADKLLATVVAAGYNTAIIAVD